MKPIHVYGCPEEKRVWIGLGDMADTIVMNGITWTALQAGSVDAAKEKHVPAVTRQGSMLTVTVGSVIHPMEEKHYIEWIALVTADRADIRYLKPGEEPKAAFTVQGPGEVYAYCNLHGLWKAVVPDA